MLFCKFWRGIGVAYKMKQPGLAMSGLFGKVGSGLEVMH